MLRTIFVLAILLPGLVASLRSRFVALLLYLWFAMFRPEAWMWMDITPYRPSLVIGLLVLVPSLVTGIFPNLTHPLSIGALLFLVSGFLGQLNAVNPEIGWSWLDYMTRLLVIGFLAVTIVRTRKQFVITVAVLAGSFGFHSAKAGLASILAGGARFSEGLAGAFVDNNGYALGTVMILPFLVMTAQNVEHKWLRIGFWVAVPLSMMTVVSTYSRGGFLAMGVAIFTFILLQRRRALAIVLFIVLAVPAVAFMPMPKGYMDRMETIQTYDEVQEGSALGRLHFWRVAVMMVEAEPLGIGLRNFESAYDRFDPSNGAYGVARQVHSSHFEVLAENGYLGAAVWVVLFSYALVLALRIRRRSRAPGLSAGDGRFLLTSANAMTTSMVAFLVGGAFIALSLNDLTWLTFSLVAALDRISRRMIAEAAVPGAERRIPELAIA